MVQYAPCLHPFFRSLEEILPKIRIGQRKRQTPVLACADDMTVFITQLAVFTTIHQAVRLYELAIGDRLNPHKTKALAVGAWKDSEIILRIEFHDRVNILGVTFGPQ